MAQAASKDKVKRDLEGPDYKGAVTIVRDKIVAKKSKIGEVNREIAGLKDLIEKKGVNKKGANIFASLDGLEESERQDILRTVVKMGEAAGWNAQRDLVDEAEGTEAPSNVLEMPTKAKGDKKLDVAEFKAAVVERLTEGSDLSETDAYALANKIYDVLADSEKKKLTPYLATQKADEEMESWPEDGAE